MNDKTMSIRENYLLELADDVIQRVQINKSSPTHISLNLRENWNSIEVLTLYYQWSNESV